MAISELQSRLEHLVTYSSQLIFISGESIAKQQQSLHNFLGHQGENAEIALIKGESDTDVQSYRRQIHRQLLGDQAGVFTRPLNELLSPLNHHQGPVLICITQAEHLDQSFLQELWDLVLQSRFASNKQHLNVLLFGQPMWAEQAKNWLPEKNRDKPLLLSTESVNSEALLPSDLDSLIAQRRRQFDQRLRDRAQPEDTQTGNVQTWWFRVLVGIAFLATFSGILTWQYSDLVPELWTQLEQPAPPVVAQIKGQEQVQNQTQNSDEVDIFDKLEIIQQPLHDPEQSEPRQADVHKLQPEQLVTDWQTAVNKIAQSSAIEVQISDEAGQTDISASLESALAHTEATPQPVTEHDYQVEDIVSVAQLPAAEPATPSQTHTSPTDTVQVLESKVTLVNTDAGTQVLLDLDENTFVLQVTAMSDAGVKDAFIRDNQLKDRVWVYTTQRYGGDWHVLLHNASYPSIGTARAAINRLPDPLQQGQPFVKSAKQVKKEIILVKGVGD